MQTDTDHFQYTGESDEIFSLGLRTAFLTLITLGIYRFWARTRIRRYIWSATRLGGESFEYTGTGIEKFFGFLVAVVFLAIYLGVIQMLLFYFGFVLFVEPQTQAEALGQAAAVYLSFLAVLPFLFFAIYRARRYKMARTRWRGIRCGMEKGAWGYVWRAILYWALTILSLGLLLPLKTFRLEKYMADRSWLGDARVTQEGAWTRLYGAMKHLLLGLAILVLGVALAVVAEMEFLPFLTTPVGAVWFAIGVISYRVQSFAYLTTHKVVEGDIRFDAAPSTWVVIRTWLVGSLIIGVVSGIAFGIIGGIAWTSLGVSPAGVLTGETFVPGLVVAAVLYIAVLLAAGAAGLALILQPILAHYITSVRVENLAAVDAIRQREHDTGADAEGFADALDIGGAI